MTRVLYGLVAGLVAVVLAGCTGGAGDPSGESSWVETPVVATPTPQWTDEEEAAIEAVQEYLDVWAAIAQGLPDSDVNAIRYVAGDPAANDAMDLWRQWREKGWHLVNGPTFSATQVMLGGVNGEGQRYHVYGCFATAGSYLSDAAGERVGSVSRESAPSRYEVIRVPDGSYFITDDIAEDGSC